MSWMPPDEAARIIDVLEEQIALTERHCGRVRDRRDRYAPGITRDVASLELAYWQELQVTLQAVRAGKTLPPS
jgi:hypothetical protein